MTNTPLVSIGLPVFNGAKYIQQALDSLLAQSYANFELNISDNASTDGTNVIDWISPCALAAHGVLKAMA